MNKIYAAAIRQAVKSKDWARLKSLMKFYPGERIELITTTNIILRQELKIQESFR